MKQTNLIIEIKNDIHGCADLLCGVRHALEAGIYDNPNEALALINFKMWEIGKKFDSVFIWDQVSNVN